MNLKEISFFKQFSCMMGSCPNTCCKGWRVVFDDETYGRYLREPGKNGRLLRRSIQKIDEEVYFRASLKRCTFLEKEGTCNLQRTIGTDYMPLVCRVYPRFYQHYGAFAEESLFLSCPRAAELFLEHLDELYYVPSGRQVSYERWGTNEDRTYLNWLLELREELISWIWDERYSRAQIMAGMGRLAQELQRDFIAGKPMPDILEIMQKHKNDGVLEIHATITDQMLTNGFYHRRLKQISPGLYSLCRFYFKRFDGLTLEQADARARELRAQLHRENPSLDHVLRGYLVYDLLASFLEVYEDYSFVKKIAGGMIHTHMLELFLALYVEQKKTLPNRRASHTSYDLPQDTLALLISIYERRGRHNSEVFQGMYERFYPVLDEANCFPAP
jgi:Fe-S-cluster containining protein